MSRRDFICPDCKRPLGIVRPSLKGGRILDLLPMVDRVEHMDDQAPDKWYIACRCGQEVEWEGDGVRWEIAA